MPDIQALRALMAGEPHIDLAPQDGWYELDIREFKGGLLVQVWASVAAVTPNLCPKQTADALTWPGMTDPMTHSKADALTSIEPVYLDDHSLFGMNRAVSSTQRRLTSMGNGLLSVVPWTMELY